MSLDGPILVVVYRFDDGHSIARITHALSDPTWTSDWGSVEGGYQADYLVLDPQGVKLLRFGFTDVDEIDPIITRWRSGTMYENFIGDKHSEDRTWRKWALPFLEDMVVPLDESIDGQWANFRFPVFVPDAIWQRMATEGPSIDAALEDLATRYHQEKGLSTLLKEARELAYGFIKQLLEPYFTDTRFDSANKYRGPRYVSTDFGGMLFRFELKPIGPHRFSLEVVDLTTSHVISRKLSLEEMWLDLVDPAQPHIFPNLSPIVRQSEQESWWEEHTVPGTPTFAVEMFMALSAVSPILWDHDRFMAFWRALPEETQRATALPLGITP